MLLQIEEENQNWKHIEMTKTTLLSPYSQKVFYFTPLTTPLKKNTKWLQAAR